MYELIVERSFSAAHCLRGYEGACARVHGHNYRVELSVTGSELAPTGYLMDFGELKEICESVIAQMDHRMLNELAPFVDQNPTSENIAAFIYRGVREALAGREVAVNYVRVWETPGQSATYREE